MKKQEMAQRIRELENEVSYLKSRIDYLENRNNPYWTILPDVSPSPHWKFAELPYITTAPSTTPDGTITVSGISNGVIYLNNNDGDFSIFGVG